MTMEDERANHLDDLRMALSQGMTHLVSGMVKAALVAGHSKKQLLQIAAEVGPYSAKEAVRRALDEWGGLESRRQASHAVAQSLRRSLR